MARKVDPSDIQVAGFPRRVNGAVRRPSFSPTIPPWRYGVLPILLNLLITALLLVLLLTAGSHFFATIRSNFGDGWLWSWPDCLSWDCCWLCSSA